MIPIATTTVTVRGVRPQSAVDPGAEGYDPQPTPVDLITGLRATISLPAFKRQVPADQVDIYALRTDPFEITRHDTIIDEKTGQEYEVDSAGPSPNETFGLTHTVAYIKVVRGLKSGGADDGTSRL